MHLRVYIQFQKLPHFGPYQRKREEQLSKLYKECAVKEELLPHHNGVQTDFNNGTDKRSQNCAAKKIPSVRDVIGRALPRIGAYKELDNTKQVVALIDDVSLIVVRI